MRKIVRISMFTIALCCFVGMAVAAPAKTAKKAKLPNFYKYEWREGEAEPTIVKTNRPQNYIKPYVPADSQLEILVEEVEWINLESIGLAIEDMSKTKGYDSATANKQYAELKKLCKAGFEGLKEKDAKAVSAAKRAVELKRTILMSNPLLVGKSVVASNYKLSKSARNAMASHLGSQTDNWSPQINSDRSGFNASIVEISNIADRDKVKATTLYKAPRTSPISEMRLHWDGTRVMFTQTQKRNDLWNIYELKLDGKSTAEKIVDCPEPDVDFFDAAYLPDGRFIVNTNLGYNGVPCVNGKDAVSNAAVYDPKTKKIRQITFDQDSNWNPVVMNNGKVMYTRWEYTDLTHYYSRIVMHMNPDGTENKALFGSGSMFPNSTFDVQPLPNQPAAFIGVISGHHGTIRSGRLIIMNPLQARAGVEGMVQEIPYRNRPIVEEVKDRLVDESWPHFYKPTVINEKYFLVAAKLSPTSLWGIYLVDVFDNVTCIMQTEDEGYSCPSLITKTKTPPAIPEKIVPGSKTATFFIQDLYEGEGLKGVPRGTVKEVRLFAYEYAYIDTKSDHDWQGIQSGWDIKRQLGTAPVQEDGSVIFIAPANTPISIQPIDKDGVAVQWMRSWVIGQPGEVVSCVGCHENQNHIPVPKRVKASQMAPKPITPPEGGVRSFTFDLEMQPILDRACIACHNGSGKAFDLRAGAKDELGFGPSYMNIMPYVRRQGGEGDMQVLTPYEYHPNTSELVRLLKKGHHNVELTDYEWRRIYAWIDHNAPDKGSFDYNVPEQMPIIHNPAKDQYTRRIELKNKYGGGMSVDWKKEIADYATYLKSKGEITPVMPEKSKNVKVKNIKVKGYPFDAAEAKAKQGANNRKEIEIAPGVKMNFVRIPAGEFVMGSYAGDVDAYPTSKVKIDKAFWMAELETTNEQMRALMSHNSKYVDQQWKDHVIPGYPANDPDQPAIRLSYNKAVEYCELLSKKTGLKVSLPTEAQWEWACRAGSADDFWYGAMGADFSTKENLADKTTLDFAVIGIDPQPMKPNHPKYQHYIYLPKDVNSNDGALVMVGGKKYEANPFGLYNMHGNVAEWTSSDYLPYPYTEKSKVASDYKVVRGGSYFERPKYSTSHTRKYYFPYQSVYNVGFRVIIED